MKLLQTDFETLIAGMNSDDDGAVLLASKAQAGRLLSAGFITEPRFSRFGIDAEITAEGKAFVKKHAYGCGGCGDWTIGTESRVRTYDCCPDCIERCTDMNQRHDEPDDDPGPFRAKRFPKSLKLKAAR